MISQSRILVIASHDADTIRRFCNKAALLETGRLIRIGPVDQIIATEPTINLITNWQGLPAAKE